VQPSCIAPDTVNLIASGRVNTTLIASALINIENSPEYYE
jgi:hypothetical protein